MLKVASSAGPPSPVKPPSPVPAIRVDDAIGGHAADALVGSIGDVDAAGTVYCHSGVVAQLCLRRGAGVTAEVVGSISRDGADCTAVFLLIRRRRPERRSTRLCRPTYCGTASTPIYWSPTLTSGPSNTCSVTRIWTPQSSTCTSRSGTFRSRSARLTRSSLRTGPDKP